MTSFHLNVAEILRPSSKEVSDVHRKLFEDLKANRAETARQRAVEHYVQSLLGGELVDAVGYNFLLDGKRVQIKSRILKKWDDLKNRYVDLADAAMANLDELIVVLVAMNEKQLSVRRYSKSMLQRIAEPRTTHRLWVGNYLDEGECQWPDLEVIDPRG